MIRGRTKRGERKPRRPARSLSDQQTPQQQIGRRNTDRQQSSSASGLLLAGGLAFAGYFLLSGSSGSSSRSSEGSEEGRLRTERGKKGAAMEAARKKARDLSGAAAIG